MDDQFQGNSNSEEKTYIAEDLDLFNVSTKSKKHWILPDKSATHQAIEILIFQGISYNAGAKIMERIRNTIGKKDISLQNFTLNDKKLKEWGLSSEKISGIRKILTLPEVNSKTLCKVKEGGIYLVKMFKVISQEEDDVFIWEDYNILRVLGILFYRDKPMTKQEAMIVSRNWKGYRSQISYFLHRIRDSGAVKILEEEHLEAYDFWGCEKPPGLTQADINQCEAQHVQSGTGPSNGSSHDDDEAPPLAPLVPI